MRIGDPQEIGKLMREKRKSLGFTLDQMAEATGLSFITIFRLEKGRTGYIHNKTAKALEALEINRRMLKKKTFVVKTGDNAATLDVVEPKRPSFKERVALSLIQRLKRFVTQP